MWKISYAHKVASYSVININNDQCKTIYNTLPSLSQTKKTVVRTLKKFNWIQETL